MQENNFKNDNKLLNFGVKIKIYRVTLALSQTELAKRCGFSYSYIRLVETGQTNISFLRLLRLSKALGVTPQELVDGLEEL